MHLCCSNYLDKVCTLPISTHTCRTYESFAMETILATAFGRVIDIQRGEADKLTKACTSFFSSTQNIMTSLALIVVLLSEF